MAVDLSVFKRGKMVKTRHSGDLDESLDDEFMSLRPRGTRGKSLFSAQMNVSTKKHHSYIVGMSKQHHQWMSTDKNFLESTSNYNVSFLNIRM